MLHPYNLDPQLAKRALEFAADFVGFDLNSTNAQVNIGVSSGRQPPHLLVEVDPGPAYWPVIVPVYIDTDGKLYVPEAYRDMLAYWGDDLERSEDEIEDLYNVDLIQHDDRRGSRGRGNDNDRRVQGRGGNRNDRSGGWQRDSRNSGGRGGRQNRDRDGGRGGRDRESDLDRRL